MIWLKIAIVYYINQTKIGKAKSETNGIIAVNIMYAMKEFYELVMGSIEAGVDMIITGAGFSNNIKMVAPVPCLNADFLVLATNKSFGKIFSMGNNP